MANARDRALELVEMGMINAEDLLAMALNYMSTDEVADMLDANELSERFQEDYDEEPDVDEAQEWADFDPDC